MGTNYIAPIWRMPRNANKNKLSNYSTNFTQSSSEYINCGNVEQLQNASVITWNCWVNFATANFNIIFGKHLTTTNDAIQLYTWGSGILYFWIKTGGVGTVAYVSNFSSLVNVDEWHMLTMVYDGTKASNNDRLSIYLDGGSANIITNYGPIPTTLPNTTDDFYIGRGTNGYFNGKLSQISIFDYALSTDQINYLYNLNNPMAITGAEPVAYWPLGDNSNPNAPGSFPNISVGADSVFDFPQITGNDYIDTNYNLDGLTSFTVSAWFNADNTTANAVTIVSTRTGTISASKGLDIYIAANGLYWRVYNNGATQILQTFTNTTDWQHVVLTYDGSVLRAYLNGSLVNSATGSYVTSNANMLIGKWNNGVNYFRWSNI